MFDRVRTWVHSTSFQRIIIGVIILNGLILGIQTLDGLSEDQSHVLEMIDDFCLILFCIELSLKLLVMRFGFLKNGWNVFDLIVVGIALAPSAGELSVLRTLRVLRLMRLTTASPTMRRVVSGMFKAIPGAASVAGVLFVMYYVAAVMGTNFFHASNPELFGELSVSFFTLFKMMTLEGWPDIAEAVLIHHPHAWPFFVIFIILTTFTTLNLLFGIIVAAMEEAKEEDTRIQMVEQGIEVREESNEVRLVTIENDVRYIRELLTAIHSRPTSTKEHESSTDC